MSTRQISWRRSVRRLILTLGGLLLTIASAPGQLIKTERYRGNEIAANQIIVRFARATANVFDEVRREHNADRVRGIGGTGAVLIHSRSKSAATLIAELKKRSDVLYAEPDYVVRTTATVPNDPLFGDQWGLLNTGQPVGGLPGTAGADVKATAAWDVSTGNRNSVVAMIDTGIDYTHPDLAANLWSAPSSFTVTIGGQTISCRQGSHGFNAIALNDDPLDDHGHGTHTAGTVGAAGNNGLGVAGVNWTASLLACKFINASGVGLMSDAINSIEFAVQVKELFGAKANVRVLSNSWGGYYSDAEVQALTDEIARAYNSGMLFVAAAGNNHSNVDLAVFYPAHLNAPNMITVAATDPKDQKATFSNYGATVVHVGAPGILVLSTVPGGAYEAMNGTSMAAPFVSGAAALLLSIAPALTTDQVKALLLGNVDADPFLTGLTSTGGRLNIYKAMQAAAIGLDFTITADTPEGSVTPGSSVDYGLTVAPVNGFGGTVSFSADGLPTGASATFSPASVDGSGGTTMTVTTAADTPSGSYPFTVHATSGTWSHTVTVTVNVTDFSVSVTPASQSVSKGGQVQFTVTITGLNGFDGSVGFAVTGLPKGATAAFSPSIVTGSGQTVLTVTTRKSTRRGSYSSTVTASSGSLTRTTAAALTVTNK